MRQTYELKWVYTDTPKLTHIETVVARSSKEAKKKFEAGKNERIVSVRAV